MNRFEQAVYNCMIPTARLLERTTDPLHRAILLNFWRHVHLEGAGDYQRIVAPDMMVDEPVYRVTWGASPAVIAGKDGVLAFYNSVGESVLWHSDDRLAVGDWGICDELTFHQLARGADLKAVGYDVADAEALYHVSSRQAFIWPYDSQARLAGEHLYEDKTSLAIEEVGLDEAITPVRVREIHREQLAALEAERGDRFWLLGRGRVTASFARTASSSSARTTTVRPPGRCAGRARRRTLVSCCFVERLVPLECSRSPWRSSSWRSERSAPGRRSPATVGSALARSRPCSSASSSSVVRSTVSSTGAAARTRGSGSATGTVVPRAYAWRAAQLTSLRNRRMLARTLRLVAENAQGRPVGRNRPRLIAARQRRISLEALAKMLERADEPVTPAGMLRVTELITAGAGPLWGTSEEALGEAIETTLAVLAPPSHRGTSHRGMGACAA